MQLSFLNVIKLKIGVCGYLSKLIEMCNSYLGITEIQVDKVVIKYTYIEWALERRDGGGRKNENVDSGHLEI